ncbi:hypothetical protein [Bacillus subtilis]
MSEKDFKVTEEEFDNGVNYLKREGYLTGIYYLIIDQF